MFKCLKKQIEVSSREVSEQLEADNQKVTKKTCFKF